jgi:fatty acid-binding protein DegV
VIAHADRPKIAAELVERMRPIVSGEPSLTVVGPVVGCHSGPGAIGVGFHKPIS